jgi:FAD/FMN-containing dehydrogenase
MATEIAVDRTDLSELRARFAGDLVGPSDPTYDLKRRVWNGSIDRFPALIARCSGVADVIAAVRFARSSGLLVAVRGGGHSYPGHSVCDGGIVIDLGPMKGIRVDPQARTARVQAGALWGELDHETQAFGLATTGGFVSHTGVAGLTLGGGIGWLHRKHGLTIDQLLSVDLVTAQGELVKASETESTELFWALRGGGGNFGIVTEFEFRLHPVGPAVLAGPIYWPAEEMPALLRFYREWVAETPDELTTILVQRRAPAVDFVPAELHGEPIVAVVCCWAGATEDGEEVLRPLKTFGSPVLDLCQPKPYVAHQTLFDAAFPHGWHYYFRACDVAELSDDVIDTMVEYGERIVSPITSVAVWQMGGAVACGDESATAFNGRGAAFIVNINGNSKTADGFEDEREWARAYWSALEPRHTSVYVNFLMDEGDERIRQAYGVAKYERLKALKRTYDPTNFFRLNQNIPPDRDCVSSFDGMLREHTEINGRALLTNAVDLGIGTG